LSWTSITGRQTGGNEMAQLSVAEKGVATTSEKYTIAHSNHVGLKFIALKWQNLPTMVDDGESLSDDFTYRVVPMHEDDSSAPRSMDDIDKKGA